MRLRAPSPAPLISLVDIDQKRVPIGQGRRVVVSLFREASCPFCNFRVYELTHNHQALSSLGIDLVVVFHSTREDVARFIARQPRPFRMVADPDGQAHDAFGVDKSLWGKIKAMMLRMPALFRGMRLTGLRGTSSSTLMPADFLIDEYGEVVETYYGSDAGDHIPIERLVRFATNSIASHSPAELVTGRAPVRRTARRRAGPRSRSPQLVR